MNMDYRQKFISGARALGKGMVEAVVSSEAKDRDGDIIRVAGWSNLDEFMKYPVMLSSHNYGTLSAIIGHWEDMAVKGKNLVGVGEYHVGDNEEALQGYRLVERGLAAYSVGFKPDMSKAKELEGNDSWFPNWEFNGQELLEVSHVTIPANADALQRAKGLKMHPVIDEIIADALNGVRSSSHHSGPGTNGFELTRTASGKLHLKSKHGEHDHDEEGQHDHDEDKALLLAQVRDLVTLQLSPAIYKEVAKIVRGELATFKAESAGATATDYLTIALQAKERVLRGY